MRRTAALGHLLLWHFFESKCEASLASVWSVESSVINDNELYFLGTAVLMEEMGQRGRSGWSQLFRLALLLIVCATVGPPFGSDESFLNLWFISLCAETSFFSSCCGEQRRRQKSDPFVFWIMVSACVGHIWQISFSVVSVNFLFCKVRGSWTIRMWRQLSLLPYMEYRSIAVTVSEQTKVTQSALINTLKPSLTLNWWKHVYKEEKKADLKWKSACTALF